MLHSYNLQHYGPMYFFFILYEGAEYEKRLKTTIVNCWYFIIVDISLFKIFVEYNMQCARWPGVDSRQCVDELIHLFAGSK